MTFCTNCGAAFATPNQRFCGVCGVAVTTQTDAEAGAPTASAPSESVNMSQPAPSAAYLAGVPAAQPVRPATSGLLGRGSVDPGTLTLLSIVTLSIYWFIWVYGPMQDYRRFSGRQSPNIVQLFWATVICAGVVMVMALVFPLLALIAAIALVAIDAVLFNEILKDRDLAIAQAGSPPAEGSRALLVTLIVVANVLSLTVCGLIIAIPIMIYVFLIFFRGHNTFVQAVGEETLR